MSLSLSLTVQENVCHFDIRYYICNLINAKRKEVLYFHLIDLSYFYSFYMYLLVSLILTYIHLFKCRTNSIEIVQFGHCFDISQRPKWAFLIEICLLFVIIVTVSYFCLLFQNYEPMLANLAQSVLGWLELKFVLIFFEGEIIC